MARTDFVLLCAAVSPFAASPAFPAVDDRGETVMPEADSEQDQEILNRLVPEDGVFQTGRNGS